MSSIAVITVIIVLLSGLVCYAFIYQTISQSKLRRTRMANALRTRIRNFNLMLNGLPAGYLPKDLVLLILRSLMQSMEQLIKLEPNDDSHRQNLRSLAQQMAETQKQTNQKGTHVPLDNPQKAQEIKNCLEELYKFVSQLEGKKGMNRHQADIYRTMIKQLVIQLSIDNYVLHGRVAREKDKLRLAVHYYDLALQLMMRERATGQFDERISQLQLLITELKAQTGYDPSTTVSEKKAKGSEEVNEKWDEFEKENNWKKKQVYD